MKKLISIFTSTLLFVISFGINAEAQLAKQGNFNGKFSVGGKVLSMHMIGKAPGFILAEYYGHTTNDAGKGIFHMNSNKCHFAIEVTQMPNTVGNGLCTFRDKYGDTITFRGLAKGTLGGPSDATMDLVHGTGKYKGITGSGWYKATPVPSFEQGTFQVFGRFGGSYKIP